MASAKGYNYALSISKPFGEIERVLEWCKQELTGDWRWQLVEVSSPARPGQYIFYFDLERDLVAFTIKCS
jgi:hypothetical protein